MRSKDEFLDLGSEINNYLANEKWTELDSTMDIIEESKFIKDQNVLRDLFGKIEIPQKHWITLENMRSGCKSILRLICFFSDFGDRDLFYKYFVNWGGHISLQKHLTSKLCTVEGHMLILGIMTNFVAQRNDNLECVKYVMPAAQQFKDMVLKAKVDFRVMKAGVNLIYAIASVCDMSGQFMPDIFKTGISSYAIKVISAGNKPDSTYLNDMQRYNFWNSLCWTISVALPEDGVIFDMKDLSLLTQNLCKIVEKVIPNFNDHYEGKIILLYGIVTSLYELVRKALRKDNIAAMKDYGIIDGAIRILQIAFSAKKPSKDNHDLRLNCFMLISSLIEVEPNVRVIAPILGLFEKFLAEHSISHNAAQVPLLASTFCLMALQKGSDEDVRYLVKKGLLHLMAKATVHIDLTNADIIKMLAQKLYLVILAIPETDEFSLFEKQHANAFFNQFMSSNVPSADKILFGYVIAAIDISSLKANSDRIKSINDYFLDHFQKIERGGTAVSLIHPISFLLRKMIKANCFKVTVLTHLWYLASSGCEHLIEKLYTALPEIDCHKKVSTKEQMKEQVLKHLLEEVKIIIDRKAEHSKKDLIKLTNFLTLIPCQDQCDIVLYQLEDLVSYCLDLIEDQSNKKIVTNVKKFIKNLHYS